MCSQAGQRVSDDTQTVGLFRGQTAAAKLATSNGLIGREVAPRAKGSRSMAQEWP